MEGEKNENLTVDDYEEILSQILRSLHNIRYHAKRITLTLTSSDIVQDIEDTFSFAEDEDIDEVVSEIRHYLNAISDSFNKTSPTQQKTLSLTLEHSLRTLNTISNAIDDVRATVRTLSSRFLDKTTLDEIEAETFNLNDDELDQNLDETLLLLRELEKTLRKG